MYKDIQTANPKIKVHITWTPKAGKTVLRGYPIDAKTGIRIDGLGDIRRTAYGPEELELTQGYIVNAVMEKLAPSRKTSKGDGTLGELNNASPIVQTYLKLRDSRDQINNWAESTQKASMSYFERNVLPEIQDCTIPEDFTPADYDELKQKLIMDSLSDARSHKHLGNASSGARTHLYESAVIYAALLELNPALPELSLLVEIRSRREQIEQIKSLPSWIQRNFRECVETIADDDPKLARAAAIMESCAFRTSEAAAVTSNEIIDYGQFVLVSALWQEYEGKRVSRLKSKHGYRRVVSDDWGTFIIQYCNDLIGAEDGDEVPVTSARLSAWIKDALKKSGCDEKYIREATRIMQDNPEYDETGNPYADTVAYILRRNRAGIWKNICGFAQDEIDYLLAHKPVQKRAVKFNTNDSELLEKWHMMNTRFDLSPELSNNPAHEPIKLFHGAENDIMPMAKVRLRNTGSQALKVKLCIRAAESGEMISIQTSGEFSQGGNVISHQTDGKRSYAEIIGVIAEEDTNGKEER